MTMPSFRAKPALAWLAFVAAASLLTGCQSMDGGRGDVLGQYAYVTQLCLPTGSAPPAALPVQVVTTSSYTTVSFRNAGGSAGKAAYEGRAGGAQYATALLVRWGGATQYGWQLGGFSHLPKGLWGPWAAAEFVTEDPTAAWSIVNTEPYARSESVPANGPKLRVMLVPYGQAPSPVSAAPVAGC